MSQDNDEVKYEFFKNHPADGSNAPRLGRSNRNRLNESFKNQDNPAIIPNYSQKIAERYQSVLDGISIGDFNAPTISEAQRDLAYSRVVYGFEEIRMNYNHQNNPNYLEINSQLRRNNSAGRPGTAFSPNTNSPVTRDTIPSTNPSDIPAQEIPRSLPFSVLNPSTSSDIISQQNLLKRKILGRSFNV
jgi:hypothetical protein